MAVPEDTAAGLPLQTEEADAPGERQHARLPVTMPEALAWTPCRPSRGVI